MFIRPKILRDQAAGGFRDRPQVQLHARPAAQCGPYGGAAAAGRHARHAERDPAGRAADGAAARANRGSHRRHPRRPARRSRRPRQRANCAPPGQPAPNDTANPVRRAASNSTSAPPGSRGRAAPAPRQAPTRADGACRSPSPSVTGVLVNRVANGVAECTYRETPRRRRWPRCAATCAARSGSSASPEAEFDALLRRAYEAGIGRHAGGRGALMARPTSLTSPRTCPSRPICSTARTTRRSSASINAVLTAGGEGERLGHPRRAVREPPRGALPRRRRAARSAAVQACGGAAGGLAHQGHVAPGHRREAPAAGRPHQPAHRRARGRRARLHHPFRSRRARGAAHPRQAGRQARPRAPRHGCRARARLDRRADPQAARHPAGHRPDRLGQDHHAVRRARAPERQHAATS